ncbi:pentapeptide repeat-containing protein [Pseudonocardia sp. H11422]|uniref:pentapeptide repeat-containing protein n=1 Tax=Pseudonocardia sp. H11422 TaxID=2835866 RepID=UPI001BDD258A|nr:pentapeptide repeat-containing protein [Pseudonocardia sp. H11422]
MSNHTGDLRRLTDGRQALQADCARCAGLCCVAPAFVASADFAMDKRAEEPCPNLRQDFRCGMHETLRERGFPGCTVFDCFGAGQQVTQVTFGGDDWRRTPAIARSMFEVFSVMRQLHELLWYLAEAVTLPRTGPLVDELTRARERTESLTSAGPDELATMDITSYRKETGALLQRVSDAVRAGLCDRAPDHRGADLMGANLRRADLHGASLRGAYLIAADLQGADLRKADLLGADLRAADLRGANLEESIFLTQPQVNAARGDAATTVPASLTRPEHWADSTTNAGRPAPRGRRKRRR